MREDVSQFTRADLFNGVGKRTPMFARFSTVAGELGSADTARDPRGFALKLYTQEGNYDFASDPVYAPNSYGGPAADEARYGEQGTWEVSGEMVRAAYELHAEDDDFGQPGTLGREVMSQTDRDHLVTNILGHASDPDVTAEMKPRIVQYWTNVDPDIGGARVGSHEREEPAESMRM